MIEQAIRTAIEGRDLDREEMREVFGEVMDGRATEVQKSALLVALKMKGETDAEIAGAAEAMRARSTRLALSGGDAVDTCGTGGDGGKTFNVSTVAALVAAGAGARVAKHGNRAVSSSCGSADLLAALGVRIDLTPDQTCDVFDRAGMAFLFAPSLHPAMSAVAAVRRELGVRTIFNVLGPLTNPMGARRQVIGVYAPQLVELVARVLAALGAEHALVVHGEDGLDEISVSARTRVAEVRDGEVRLGSITPDEIGLRRHPIAAVAGGAAGENAAIARAVLTGANGARHDIVVANAGAALYVAGRAGSIAAGVRLARESIQSGSANAALERLVTASNAAGGVA